jgi:hypothetical protein
MYDPLVVDAFVEVISDDSVHCPAREDSAVPLYPIPPTRFKARPGVLRPLELHPFPEALDVSAQSLAKDHNTLLVLFVPDSTFCDLVVASTWGSGIGNLPQLRIPIGKRISGWVAATGQPVFDTDASLDFVDSSSGTTRLNGRCDATPVSLNNQTLAVLTMYRTADGSTGSTGERELIALADKISRHFISKVVSV